MHRLRRNHSFNDGETRGENLDLQPVEQHENDESLKMEEGSVSRIWEGKEPRRKQSPDGEFGKVKDRSRVAHEEIGKKESTKVFGEEKLFEWQPGQGELCGVIGGD